MAKKDDGTEKTDAEIAEERAADLRRANDNGNQKAIDRRNAIADDADRRRDGEFADITDDGKIVARSREDDEEARARQEDADAEAERARLAQGDTGDGTGTGESDVRTHGTTAGDEDETDSRMVDGKRQYKLVVNGKEKWLTLSEIRERAGKVDAADEYLQAAAESARKATALAKAPKEEVDEEPDAELVEDLNKALLGDQDSVKKLARRLGAAPSRVTPDVLQAVDERLTFRDAVGWFETEYSAELKDPRLKQMIVAEDVRLRDENPTMGYKTRLKAAGDSIRVWAKGLGWKPPPGDKGNGQGDSQQNDKLRRKQLTAPVPSAGGRQGSGDDPDAEEPVSAQIQRIAESRHQARSIKH